MYDADFVFRRHARIDRDVRQLAIQLGVRHLLQLYAGYGNIPVRKNAQLTRNRCRCNFMITGNHDGFDAAAFGIRHRLNRFRTRRIYHGNQTEEGKAALVLQLQLAIRVQLPICKRQHAQALLGHLRIDANNLLPQLRRQRNTSPARQHMGRAVEQAVYGALCKHGRHTVDVVQGAHAFAVGVKGKLAQPRMLFPICFFNHAELFAQHDKCYFRRVTDGISRVLIMRCIAGEQRGFEQHALHRIGQLQLFLGNHLSIRIQRLRRHFVLRQRAGFVRANDGHAAQALYRLQILDDGILPRHLLRSHGEHNRDDGRQRFRNGRHGERHSKHQRIQNSHAGAEYGQSKHARTDDENANRQLRAECVQALLQRCFALLSLVHQCRNLAQLRVHAGRCDKHRCAAVGHQ